MNMHETTADLRHGGQLRSSGDVSDGLSNLILEQATEAIIVCDPQGIVIRANQVARSLSSGNPFGKHFDSLYKIKLNRINRGSDESSAGDFSIFQPLNGGRLQSVEVALKPSDDIGLCLLLSAGPLVKDETVIGCVVTLTNVNDCKLNQHDLNESLENRISSRTDELEDLNREVEAFAYSVSHDLSAPLRSINGMGKVLEEEYMNHLPKEAQDLIRRIRGATKRMGQYIDDMLKLSRLTGGEMFRSMVDMTAIAKRVAEDLRAGNPEREVQVHIAENMLVHADGNLVRVIIENIFANSWKFTRRCLHPRIEFFPTKQDNRTIFCVRDNGVGFDMTYADKLFDPFQRLHSMTEYEGNGIGLATVQRVVRRHGGRIWAESEVNRGTSVYFTLSG